MNILLTGSEGFIGRYLGKKIARDHELYTIDRKPTVQEGAKKHFVGNLADKLLMSSIDVPIDFIYHFGSASSVRSFQSNPEMLANSEIMGFVNILNFAKERKVKTLVYPSTASVYTRDGLANNVVIGPSNIYGAVKFAEEQIALHFSPALHTVGLRIFMAYGPGEERKGNRASPIYLFIKDILRGNDPIIYGDGNQIRDALYIDDLVAILHSMLNQDCESGIYDVCTGIPITFNMVVSEIEKVMGQEIVPKYIPVPKSYIKGVTGNPEFGEKLLNRPFTSIESGIRKTVEYTSKTVDNSSM